MLSKTFLCASILKILKLYGIDVTEWLSSKIMKSKPGEGAGTIGEGKGENAGKNEETGKRDEAGNGKGEETGKDEIGNGKGEEPGKSDGTGNGKSGKQIRGMDLALIKMVKETKVVIRVVVTLIIHHHIYKEH